MSWINKIRIPRKGEIERAINRCLFPAISKWINVGLPGEIMSRIDDVVTSRRYGFRSRADFVLEATKDLLTKFGRYP